MSRHPWTMTTRTATRARVPAPGELLSGNQIVQSPETGLQYRIERPIESA